MDTENSPENSLHLSYEFVIHSYEWGLSRLDAVERRLQGLLVYLATITFVPPVAIMAISEDSSLPNGFQSRVAWAFVAFVLATVFLIAAKVLRSYDLARLDVMLEQGLDKTPEEFMETALYMASEDLKATSKAVNRKTRLADVVSLIIIVEIVIWLWLWIEPLVIWL